MRISILSDCRVPTRGVGGHGLGRVAWDVAKELARRGHEITLHAGYGSTAPAGVYTLCLSYDEDDRARKLAKADAPQRDVYLDFSHHHHLSILQPQWAVVNYISDSEVNYQPPNAVVCTLADQREFPCSQRIPLGIDVESIPLHRAPREDYLAFCAKMIAHKGLDLALELDARGTIPIQFAGEMMFGMALDLPHYQGELVGTSLYQFMAQARGVLQLARIGTGGGRIQLEAAACGTPTLVLDWNGTQEHVAHCVSGFVCSGLDDLLDSARDLPLLDPKIMRTWVEATHSLRVMVDALEPLLIAAADGVRW
ncbi:MAG: hypothetical protein KF726_02495 [Anaerolineae bacterium]|nr:hypothetical protein [Anaerolineae bacterium]